MWISFCLSRGMSAPTPGTRLFRALVVWALCAFFYVNLVFLQIIISILAFRVYLCNLACLLVFAWKVYPLSLCCVGDSGEVTFGETKCVVTPGPALTKDRVHAKRPYHLW